NQLWAFYFFLNKPQTTENLVFVIKFWKQVIFPSLMCANEAALMGTDRLH
ncbi:unnamed protein product, partial [Staurois parvus]